MENTILRNDKGQFLKGSKWANRKGYNKGHPPYFIAHGKDNPFYGKTHSEETKRKMRLAKLGKPGNNRGMKHSEESRKKMSLALKGRVSPNKGKKLLYVTGEKCHFWKGGISKFTRKERSNFMNTLEYRTWRRNVFERDNYTCQICGKRGRGDLRANHIKKYADYPDLRTILKNGITICENCDIKLVLNKEEQWESYFNFNLETRRVLLWLA